MKKFLFFLTIFIQISFCCAQNILRYYPLNVEIAPDTIPLFNQSDYNAIKRQIIIELKTAWENTFSTYNQRGTQLDPCLKTAFDEWLTKLATSLIVDITEWDPETNSEKTVSTVNIDPEYIPIVLFDYDIYYKGNPLDPRIPHAIQPNTLRLNSVISFPDVHCIYEGGVSPQIKIRVFNGFRDFSCNRYRAEYRVVKPDESYTCRYEKIEYMGGPGVTYQPPSDVGFNDDGNNNQPRTQSTWSADGTVGPFSFISTIFHELAHCVLYHCSGDLETRKSDEATMEDITMKIFPNDGFNPYKYQYEYGVWKFRAMQDISGFPYKAERKSRLFNPPDSLRYDNPDYINIGNFQGIIGRTVGSVVALGVSHNESCDDARCSQLIRYRIPYLKCCR